MLTNTGSCPKTAKANGKANHLHEYRQQPLFRRFDLKTEIVLAAMSAVIIIAVLMLLEAFNKQQ